MQRLAALLRCTLGIGIAVRRRAIGCLLIRTCGKFTVLLAKEGVETSYPRFLPGLFDGRGLSLPQVRADERVAEVSTAAGLHERRIIPGNPSKPESKLRIRLIPCCSMTARCTASRADICRRPIAISFARSAVARST